MIHPIQDISYMLQTCGVYLNSTKLLLQMGVMGATCLTAVIMKFRDDMKAKELEKMQKVNAEVKTQKDYLFNQDFDLEKEKAKAEIVKEHNELEIKRKERDVYASKLPELKAEQQPFKGIKAPKSNALLLGHDALGEAVWGYEVNYIIAGTTRNGKTRKLHCLTLNYIANKQGLVIIVDLKKTDYLMYDGIPSVIKRVTELEQVKEAVQIFENIYEERIQIITDGYTDENGKHRNYIDIPDYNKRNPAKQLPEVLLLIDEFADISDCYKDKNGKPIGVYADIIKLARKCGAMNMHIVMGTQRPSADVIIGTLKNNCSMIGLKMLNAMNSRVVVDVEGCENLSKTEALAYVDGELTKIFSYRIDDEMLLEYTDKLKSN